MTDFSKLLSLASLLASERGATVQEILDIEEYGYTSRSSIYADFNNITKHFGMLVEAGEEKRGPSGREVVQHISKYDWSRFRSSFIQKILTDDDRLLLSFMLESIGSLSPLISLSKDTLLPRLKNLVGEMSINPSSREGYFALTDAKNLLLLLETQAKEGFLYISYNGTKRKLWPLKCFMFCGGIYCYVMQDDGLVYTVSVQRIEGITKPLSKKTEKRPETSFDVEEALCDPFGIVRDEKEFTAVVRLSEWQGLYEKEKAWPESVKIEKEGDHYLFTVRTIGSYWLKKWVLSLGSEAELLEPDFLRSEIRKDLEEMNSLYKSD